MPQGEFCDDVVAVPRKGDASISEVGRDFGISESCLRHWLSKADIEKGRPGVTSADSAELRELKRRNRLLEQENEVLCPSRGLPVASQPSEKGIYPAHP